MKSVEIKLLSPIKWGSEFKEMLVVREPKAKDLRKFPVQMKVLGEMLDFAGELTGEAPALLDQLSIEDSFKLFEVITDFLPSSLKTGATL